ncbi:uncharacterized protein LOC135925445 [Gordionus sp. m RMFG-2023]|uniref:uncharacterized protein LOC135925445 n=1 Tax=Gordionus sp. m RMFG-2023 TaxID=3053472 RepID=UPI0031FBBAD2
MTSTTTESTIKILRNARFGFPKIIVLRADHNSAAKISMIFVKKNGIQLVHGSPYHPQANGITERLVLTFEQSMNKRNEGDLETSLAIFLYNYRIETEQSPAEILLKIKPRGLSDQIFERGNKKEKLEYYTQKFEINEKVWWRLYNEEKKWGKTIIKSILGSLRYEV